MLGKGNRGSRESPATIVARLMGQAGHVLAVDRAFEVLGFNRIVEIYDSLDEALASLSKPPGETDRPSRR